MYYLLNINRDGESKVDFWINEKRFAPTFYGRSTIEQIRENERGIINNVAFSDAKLFIDTFYDGINSDAVVFSIGEECIYFYKQKEQLTEYLDGEYNIKGFEIEILKTVNISQCPLVLVTIKSNRYMSSGTFRKLEGDLYFGNCRAIDYVLSGSIVHVSKYDEYLQCLSSLEFETLIAKLLEEDGLFVPAYKGGYIKNYDLFCKNVSTKSILLNGRHFEPNQVISIQIKLRLKKKHINMLNDYYYCIWSESESERVIDWKKIKEKLLISPQTSKWLNTTLNWIEYNINTK